jgi:hypothetical protein
MTVPGVHLHRRSAQVALMVLGALGLPALFLPFTLNTSPHRALMDWGLWRVTLPAYLVVFILPATKRWLTVGAMSRLARVIGYALAVAAALLIFLSYMHFTAWPENPVQWVAAVGPLLILGFGARVLVGNLRPGRPTAYGPILALQVVYIANAMLGLGASFPDWQVGAYCIVITIMAYALQIDLVRKAPDA